MDVATLRSVWAEKTLQNRLNRRLTQWFESPRLSTASISSNERAPSTTPSDCPDFPSAGQRPVSLVSTLSSGSGSSRDDCPAVIAPGGAAPPTGEDIDLDLSPPEGTGNQGEKYLDTGDPTGDAPASQGVSENNNNITTPSRAASGRFHLNPLSPFAAKTMAPNPQLTYVDRVVMEIIETERMYVRDLRMIVEDYLGHIVDQADLPIRPEQVCALFGNIEDIYEFNSELLQSLDMCDNNPVAIARCFVMKSDYFEIYTQYCTNYPNSVAALTDCMRNKSLAKFFRERQASLKRSLPLGSYLLKPVQRILKYHLLLQEIAKHFDPEEDGYEVVEEAIYTMTGVAWYINDMKRKHEHAVRLQEVQSLLINWKGPDLTTYGELVLEGTFKVHRAKNERTLFLFDRMLLLTKRRGEHYVYKTHISCSTLMLIESAKDSLCFSVTHYKHPKQPHTVQAKTVEERKLWAHHIKRIILENHHAIIPQKAKEAILEMDSIYPSKYRYSPERMKKAMSYQSDEFPKEGRPGRRQSEPTKQILKNTKAILKHADSEGALPDEAHSIQSAASISTLGSSLGESEVEKPCLEEDEEEEQNDVGGRKNSLERVSPIDGQERRAGPQSYQGRLTLGEESDSDDILMEDDQVADFASSMLAAISCWHYRARALLSMGVTTDEEGCNVIEENQCSRENISGQDKCGKDTVHQTPSDEMSQSKVSGFETDERLEPAPSLRSENAPSSTPNVCSSPPGTAKAPEPVEHKVNTMEGQMLASQDSDGRTLSSGESTDEEEEEAAAAKESEASSILPSSVLDKASAIAEHFNNSIKRGSVVTDDVRSLGCPSPRLPSRTGSTISLGGETTERPHRINSTCSEPQENFGNDLTMLSPRDDGLFETDRGLHRRRNSTLSKQDQLLLGKIKNYYEHAEHQDAGFSLKRRESLTYIPTGLVRSSVSRFNSIPTDETSAAEKSDNQASGSAPITFSVLEYATTDADSSTAAENWNRMVSSPSFDSLELERGKELEASGSDADLRSLKMRSHSLQDKPIQDEEFRPSSEMIKVWQNMEREVTRSHGEARTHVKPKEVQKSTRGASPTLCRRSQSPIRNSLGTENAESLAILEESDLSTITEESMSPSPVKPRGIGVGRTANLMEVLKPLHDERRLIRAPVPRVIQLRAETEGNPVGEEPQSEDDLAKNKVLSLARQYSQRLKTTKPMVRQRSLEMLQCKKNLFSVLEENPEKESTGKPNLMLSLAPCYQVPPKDVSPLEQARSPSPSHTPSSLGSPRVPSPSRIRSKSPLSPQPMEAFNWPDVRELRSKYASDQSQLPPVGRSRSVPEKMLDCGARRRSSCYSSFYASGGPAEVQSYRSHPSRDPGPGDGCTRLHRAGSLDHRLNGLYMSKMVNLQENISNGDYYVSARDTLPTDPNHKVIVVERVPEESETSSLEPVEMPLQAKNEEVDDSYVQIRSPTTREKISIMAVIDRCRAYQESDEYRQREEGGAKEDSVSQSGKGKEHEKGPLSNEQLQNTHKTVSHSAKKTDASQQSMVKNLREKFLNLR
ncbi:pleckstrin homology domain-containing family G member 3 isoform X3 [Hypomesus transpacificus]|uniref:pleckstrin homology domain-containing family G member 3 isoform X3 n=1 Tax=Hypomesus transpacificus TaxID=137520 RepID=UPI001F07F55E|nr:pleckstrin homology domain-containing family G member 3 isoform X3 [Hypomesus transpacificus]